MMVPLHLQFIPERNNINPTRTISQRLVERLAFLLL